MNLNDLIKQGYEIKQGIRKVSVLPNGFKPFNYVQYQLSDDYTYESWKNTVIRFLAKSFPNDISNQQFQKAIEEFEKKNLILLQKCSKKP